MKKLTLVGILLPLLLAPGCPVRKFELVMERTADGKVQRALTIWTADDGKTSEPQEDALAAARAAYEKPDTPLDDKRRFSGVFAERLPADLTHQGHQNHGFFSTETSQLGSVSSYVERMPGRTDLVELVTIGEKTADTVARALVAWARRQPALQAEPQKLDRLVAFLETELRHDVFNVLLMGWHAITRTNALEDGGLESDEDRQEDFWMQESLRIAAHLIERGYLLPSEAQTDDFLRLPFIVRGALRKAVAAMGYAPSDPWPPVLAELTDENKLEQAFEAGLREIGTSPDELNAMIEPAAPGIMTTGTNGRVIWRCPVGPLHTNGTWDADARELAWNANGRQGCETPQLLYAVWAEADQTFQSEHLGRVMLEGEGLAEYVAWRAGLPAELREEWDAFLDGLRPGPELIARLERFRFQFPEVPLTTAPATQPADEPPRGAKLILGRE